MFPNLNSLLALTTLIAALANLGWQAGAVVQGSSSNQGLYYIKRSQEKNGKHPPKPDLNSCLALPPSLASPEFK